MKRKEIERESKEDFCPVRDTSCFFMTAWKREREGMDSICIISCLQDNLEKHDYNHPESKLPC